MFKSTHRVSSSIARHLLSASPRTAATTTRFFHSSACLSSSTRVIYVKDATQFDEKIKSATVPVLVDVYADWCGPCKTLAPILDKISQEYEGKIEIVKINADECSDVVEDLEVQALPTMIGFVNGKQVEKKLVGLQPRTYLLEYMREHLNIELNKEH